MERAARTLASLIKSLAVLQQVEAAAAAAPGADAEEEPYDLDGLRRDLARRLEILRRQHAEAKAEVQPGAGI
jgi:hypothetical protein